MGVVGSRVGIVGGSIAGCAMAVAARRLGCDVTVYEASSGVLNDRGAGIYIPIAVRTELAARGYLAADTPYCHPPERLWVTASSDEPAGRVMWRQPFPGAAHNWALLWRALRSLVPDESYQRGRAVRSCDGDTDGVTVVVDDGSTERFDVLVGADGYCSAVRRAVYPDIRPRYAGYVLWRGNYDEGLVPDPAAVEALDAAFLTICFPGGHAVIYLIPGRNGATGRGERRVNWAVYGTPPAGFEFTEPTSIPPGSVPGPLAERLEEIIEKHLPPVWSAVVRTGGREVLSVQPIYDHSVPRSVVGRVVLAGDAAALCRPHTASGAVKAMQEAVTLETAGWTYDTWPQILGAFDAECSPAGAQVVETSRLLGRGLVEQPPDWAAMSPDEAERFITTLHAGRTLYIDSSSP